MKQKGSAKKQSLSQPSRIHNTEGFQSVEQLVHNFYLCSLDGSSNKQDISQSYAILKQKLEEMFSKKIDVLTGLPNQTKCLEDFGVDKNRSIAILHLNNMFDINNAFGRRRGDEIIREIAKILKELSRETAIDIYKFEGTDFVMVFKDTVDETYIREQCKKVKDIKIFNDDKYIQLSFSL